MDQAILDSYYAALKAGDFAALERLLTPGVCVRYYGPPGLLPWGGVHEGFDAYRRFLGLVREHLEIIEVVQEAVIAEGEWIVVLGRGAWRARATTRHHRQHDQCLPHRWRADRRIPRLYRHRRLRRGAGAVTSGDPCSPAP